MFISQKEYEDAQQRIRQLQTELELLEKNHEKEIAGFKQEHEAETAVSQAEIALWQSKLERAEAENAALRQELNQLRGAKQDVSQLRQYNQRLMRPVSVEDVEGVYRNHAVTATPAFFQITGEHDLIWLLPRGELRRRPNGFLPNLLDSPHYDQSSLDKITSQHLPPNIKSTLNLVFAQRRAARTFTLCEPYVATEVVISFYVEADEDFYTWRKNCIGEVLASSECAEHPELQLVYLVLPFLCPDTKLHLDLGNGFDNSTAADLQLLRTQQEQRIREKYQDQYQHHFFGTPVETKTEDPEQK